jgi:xanthine dehydrogenase accessory factor
MNSVYEVIEEYLSLGRSGVLATIVQSTGSSPRSSGAKMFVGADGRSFGTVGGGSIEAEVTKRALAMAAAGTSYPVLFPYAMQSTKVEAEGMICGGAVDIFLEPVRERYREVYKAIGRSERKGRKAVIVTKFGQDIFSKSFVDMYGGSWGDLFPEGVYGDGKAIFEEKKPRIVGGDTLVEPVDAASTLYIFGAGHVSQFVSRAAKMVDFNVVVIDDRDEFANKERFPEADEVLVQDFAKAFGSLAFTGNEFVVIVTRGHRFDTDVLEETLRRETKYVGMIGSRRKVNMVLDHVRRRGFSEELLRKVYAPIGIDINSETPQEIGISIVAQLIKVRGEE